MYIKQSRKRDKIVTGKNLLIIDDDKDLAGLVNEIFSVFEGIGVHTAKDGQEGLRKFYEVRPDIVLLDLRLPDISGFELCRRIRQLSDVPILIVSGFVEEEFMVQGLEAGADDYITKPFDQAVLRARVKAMIRRSTTPHQKDADPYYNDGYLTIDLPNYQVRVDGEAVRLTATEFKLLSYLYRNAGRLRTLPQILENVWGSDYIENDQYVHSYIWNLRQKLEKDPKNPVYLITEHGVGYRFMKYY